MMLPIAKYPKFLSPSSLSQYNRMPLTFYLTRMAPDPLIIDHDSNATSLGTAIDAGIKMHICEMFGWTEKIRQRILSDIFDPLQRERKESLSLERLLIENIPAKHSEQLLLGLAVAKWYVKTPMFASLDIVDIEYHPRFSIQNSGAIGGTPVPLYCKLDATIQLEVPNVCKARVPLDIKSTSGSPNQGYAMLYDEQKGMTTTTTMKSHKIFRGDIAFSEIDESWDRQLMTYHLALAYERSQHTVDCVNIPSGLPAMIEQICVSDRVRVARFIAACGSPTVMYYDYAKMWSEIQSNKFTNELIPDRNLLEYFAAKERFW